jgi:glycosyltransferase involved in cell wall biosynthesis
VIVAVKDETDLLRQCLNSLILQTYKNTEIIVVNDGSSEATQEIINSYPTEKLQAIHFTESRGQSAARNAALAISKGDYIAIADADDEYHAERIEKEVHFMELHKDIDVLGSDFNATNGSPWPIYYDHNDIKCQMLINNPMIHSSVMIRRSSLPDLEVYNGTYDKAEDYELFASHIHSWRFANLREKLVDYNIRAHNEDSRKDQQNKARKIRQSMLRKQIPDIDNERVLKFQDFSELNRGLSLKDLTGLIKFLSQEMVGFPKNSLSKILYRQMAHYCLKNQVKAGIKQWIRFVYYRNLGIRQLAQLLYKSLF